MGDLNSPSRLNLLRAHFFSSFSPKNTHQISTVEDMSLYPAGYSFKSYRAENEDPDYSHSINLSGLFSVPYNYLSVTRHKRLEYHLDNIQVVSSGEINGLVLQEEIYPGSNCSQAAIENQNIIQIFKRL
jgi:hypothetical protein